MHHRTADELRLNASMFWPTSLSLQEEELSVIPRLLESQEEFISILGVPVGGIENLFQVLTASSMPTNLFVKHLMVLSDVGGELLKRITGQFRELFPTGEMKYLWNRDGVIEERSYVFCALPTQALSNDTLKVSGKHLARHVSLTDRHRDAIALIMFGSSSMDSEVAAMLAAGQIGEFLGKPQEISEFVHQRYIWVSRQTNGAKANSLGNLAQHAVWEYLVEHLGTPDTQVYLGGTIPNIVHTDDKKLTTFDIVVESRKRYVAIEICFQVTTNSVIERKSGQAQARYEHIMAKDYRICYVLDGAGIFERRTALQTILNHCSFAVAFTEPELDLLVRFIRAYLLEGVARA
jgi:hypothetical protein